MATWEEILAADYNPVTSMRETHQAKMNQRQAENIARMQAANPGYLPGGMGNQPTNQFQQFGPPTLMDGASDWLATQRQMAGEHFGNTGVPQSSSGGGGGAFTGGPASFGGGEGGVNEGGQGFSGGHNAGYDPSNFSLGPESAVSDATKGMLAWGLGPLAAPFMGMLRDQDEIDDERTTIINKNMDAAADSFGFGFGPSQQQADNPSGLAGVGLPAGSVPGGGGGSGHGGGAGSAGSGTGEGKSASGAGAGPHGGGSGSGSGGAGSGSRGGRD